MEFLNEKDREDYLKHPDHIIVISKDIMLLTEDGMNSVIVLDYKISKE